MPLVTEPSTASHRDERTPLGVLLWFGWAFILLVITGLLLPKIIDFVDFSPRAPFSLLGIFMMAELALVIFGITVALATQTDRLAHGGLASPSCPCRSLPDCRPHCSASPVRRGGLVHPVRAHRPGVSALLVGLLLQAVGPRLLQRGLTDARHRTYNRAAS